MFGETAPGETPLGPFLTPESRGFVKMTTLVNGCARIKALY